VNVKMPKVKIRNAQLSDIAQLRALEERVWKETPASEEMLASRIRNFPDGNIVAEIKGEKKIVGYTSMMFIKYDLSNPPLKTWAEFTDNGFCSNHRYDNPTLFGVNLSVDLNFQNQGVGTRLLAGGWDVAVSFNKPGCLLGARCPEYHKYKDQMSIEEYVKKRHKDGKAFDPEIRLYERDGFKLITICPDYMHDEESCNYGIIMFCKNPLYNYPSIISYPVAKIIKRFGHHIFGF